MWDQINKISQPPRNRRPISCQAFILGLLKSLPKSLTNCPYQEIDVEDLDRLHGITTIHVGHIQLK